MLQITWGDNALPHSLDVTPNETVRLFAQAGGHALVATIGYGAPLELCGWYPEENMGLVFS